MTYEKFETLYNTDFEGLKKELANEFCALDMTVKGVAQLCKKFAKNYSKFKHPQIITEIYNLMLYNFYPEYLN